MRLASFDVSSFLQEHWQRKPLLIRNAWDQWSNPLEPDDLAGLACEAEVESRLVRQSGDGWALEHGPFAEARFGALGAEPWTLLVQSVDHFVPAVAALLAPFRFIPNWRVDDVMVSYASDGGGVGPHFDQYDVFLVQGLGRRRWQIGGLCDGTTPLLPHDDLRLLADFPPEQEWVLEPGDILYLPPGVAHNGIAERDDCMTYSIGFRAPSRAELAEEWLEHLLSEDRDEVRYGDAGLAAQGNPGEISPEAIARLHAMLTEMVADRDAFARWFGMQNSMPKNSALAWEPEEALDVTALRRRLGQGLPVQRNPASRFSFIRQGDSAVTLFADGEAFACEAGLAERLCGEDSLVLETASDETLAVLVVLYEQGSIGFDA